MAAGAPLLDIQDLHVRFATSHGEIHAVRGVSMTVAAGETVAVVGESGSGKSQAMMAVTGLLARNGRATGRALFNDRDLLGLSSRGLNRIRGDRITMIFQEPMTSLDPLYSIGRQLQEPMHYHAGLAGPQARARAIDLLTLVGLPDPERRLRSLPHELSGGQRQRVMIAMALANRPDILIADEPTTALDVTIQAQILDLLRDLQRRLGMAILFITHDLGIVRAFADRVYVMNEGQVVEHGLTARIFSRPQEPYTRMLLAAEPAGRKQPPPPEAPPVLEGRSLRVVFHLRSGLFGGLLGSRHGGDREIRAVDGVSLQVREGQTLGIVGESGSGKSTLGRALLRLMPSEGQIIYGGRDISRLDERKIRPLRRELQLVFQDPYGSLSPRLTVGEIVSEGLLVHEPALSGKERQRRAAEALREVQLDPAMIRRYPHEFSGGQRQRIAIARALILRPRFIVLDEPTSALDRSVQKQIVELLRDLQARHRLTYIFISHDLAVVRALADTVMVMKDGLIVEAGPTEEIFEAPHSDYTRVLMAAAFHFTRASAEHAVQT